MYVGKVIATKGLLLGGVFTHETSEMETWEDCYRLCETYVKINSEAGRQAAIEGIRELT